MKKIFGFVSAFLVCGAAHAGKISCNGSYFGYNFAVNANTQGTRIVGRIQLDVSNGQERHRGNMRATSSDIRAGRYLRFSGGDSRGSGSLSANYSSDGRYHGTLHAQSPQGTATVPVVCTLRGSFNGDIDSSDTDGEFDFGFLDPILN